MKLGLKAICEKTGLSATSIMRYIDQGMPHYIDYKGTRKVYKFLELEVNEWIKSKREGK